jgi:pSer/pThr/pTyr-binding forkhead associated (FHA) protein
MAGRSVIASVADCPGPPARAITSVSRNGTRVNGLRVLEETEVRPGDRLSLGEVRFRLVLRRLST